LIASHFYAAVSSIGIPFDLSSGPLINVIYTFFLKRIPIIDVISIGVLFLLRLLLRCINYSKDIFSLVILGHFYAFIVFGLGKRRAELAALAAILHKPVRS
jgi:hypothetical protein